jgi:hypothetical protein
MDSLHNTTIPGGVITREHPDLEVRRVGVGTLEYWIVGLALGILHVRSSRFVALSREGKSRVRLRSLSALAGNMIVKKCRRKVRLHSLMSLMALRYRTCL